ncbi:MAG: SDR family oxidoreductase [Planctomycetota bacterium]
MRQFFAKRVFVTGGSSGIGKATATMLVKWGACVVIAARGDERLRRAVAEVRALELPGTIDAIVLDVTDPVGVVAGAHRVLERLGGLDLLINNAGVVHPGRVGELPADVFEAMLRVNYFGTVHMTRALLPHFMAQRSGQIANVCSMLGFMGVYGYSAYAASKFAVTGFSECLRQELVPYGVDVSLVFPPNTDTPQLADENNLQPPESRAITRRAGVLSAEVVARHMLRGIARRRFHILPGLGARLTWSLHRHAPRILRWAMDGELRRALRTNTRTPPPPLNVAPAASGARAEGGGR